ncbi:MAG TPA: glycosyltransferase family 39 protein [Candidatus Tumulicola sp.]
MNRSMWLAAALVGAAVALAHLVNAGGYGIFANELYFIVCGRHPAFGYVDQPPLLPLIAAATQIGGTNAWLLRLPAVLAAVALVPMTVALAGLLGGSTRAAWLAGVAAAASPMIIAMTAALSTSTFEPVAFTAVAYYVVRGVLLAESRAFWWAGIIAGVALEAKYGIAFWLFGIALGLALFGDRAAWRSRNFWIGAAIAVVLILPNIAWQVAHGLPFLELVRNDNAGNLTGSPFGFFLDQFFLVNVLLAPLWIAGIVAPFASKRMAPARFLSVAFVVTAVLVVATHGKDYYLAGAYPAMFAVGAAASSRLWRWFVALWAVLAAANGAFALPFVLPLVAPARLAEMFDQMKFRPPPMERACVGAPLGCIFSLEFGWREVAQRAAEVFATIPPGDRDRAAILASNYGEAAAIDVYGKGLPPALSGNNQYFLWGPRGYDGSVVIGVGIEPSVLAPLCDSVRTAARYGTSPYAMPYERNRPIVICRNMRPSLAARWSEFKRYGIEYWPLTAHPFDRASPHA